MAQKRKTKAKVKAKARRAPKRTPKRVAASKPLSKAHEVQLVNYLVATGIDIGLLLNFGQSVEIKRKHREYRPRSRNPSKQS